MSHLFVPTAAPLGSGLTLPDDGDKRKAETVNTPLEALGNAVRDLQEKLDPNSLGLNPTTTRMMGDAMAGALATLDATLDSGGGGLEYPTPVIRTTGAGSFSLAYMLDLPHGAKIQQARVYFYEDTATVSAISVQLVRRDYINVNVLPGDPADCPTETVIGTGTVKTIIAGGMRYTNVSFASHTIDRDDGSDYCVRVAGTGSGAGVRFMPKIRAYLLATTCDLGAG